MSLYHIHFRRRMCPGRLDAIKGMIRPKAHEVRNRFPESKFYREQLRFAFITQFRSIDHRRRQSPEPESFQITHSLLSSWSLDTEFNK